MACEMKDVIRAVAETFAQRTQACVGQTLERDLSALLQRAQSLLKPAPFRLNIQLGVTLRAREHDEHMQWRLDCQLLHRLWQLQVAYQRRIIGSCQEAGGNRVVHELPGQGGKFGDVVQPQGDTQAAAGLVAQVETAGEAITHSAAEQRLEKLLPELFHAPL